MPTYDYVCPTNQRTVRVQHGMSRTIATWQDLCEIAEIAPGDTPPDAPVERLVGLTLVGASTKGGEHAGGHVHSGPGCCCGPSGCGG